MNKKETFLDKESQLHYIIIIIICFFTFFLNNGIIPADIMESRNLATAQEMVRNDNYLIPTMNGELRLEKPPLPTWIAAVIEIIFPGNLIAQRCASGLISTLLVIFLYCFTSFLFRNRKIGLISSLVLATSFNIILMGRTATWDIYCHSFMLGAIYFLVRALNLKGKQWTNFLLSGIFMGFSFLSKGPVSFYALLLSFLISYLIIYRHTYSIRGKILPLISMIIIFLIISFWWMGYIYLYHQDLAMSVAQKESSSWINHNVRPWYYYWQFPAEFGIWALFLVTAIIYFFVYKKNKYRDEYKFSIIWLFASLILLSVIPEKKTRYLLPILIPGALTIGIYFYSCIKNALSGTEKNIFKINSVIIAIIVIALPVVLYILLYQENKISFVILLIACLSCWSLGIYMFRSIFSKRGPEVKKILISIILCMILVIAVYLKPIGYIFINQDINSIRALRNNQEIENLDYYYNENEELRMELVYEANHTINPLDITNDSLIFQKMPFVFVSGLPTDSLFKEKNITIKHIGTFDNNWRPTNHKRYNPELVREVVIIKAKENE